MSAPQNNENDFQLYSEDEIQVTSPTSLAIRESLRRSSSASAGIGGDYENPTDQLSKKFSRPSLFSRPPPPPPPPHPPQFQNTPPGAGGLGASASPGRPSSALNAGSSMPRNLSLNALQQVAENTTLPTTQAHGSSFGPNNTISVTSNAPTPMISTTTTSTSSFAMKKDRATPRRSIFRDTVSSFMSRETSSSIPENIPAEIRCEGYLTKRGHVFTNWKTRYFVLRGNVLEYFSGEDKSKRYGAVTVAKVAPWTGESHGFMFYTTKQIPYYVYAASESERAKWMRALKELFVEPEAVTCEGYLTKRGHLVPSQRMCYYVLMGTSLRHYADQQAYRDNQSAMAEVEIKSVSAWDGQSNGLVFRTVTGNMFYVYAETSTEQQKWLSSLRQSVTVIQEPVSCMGYLTKQGHKRKSWKKRYFVLRGNLLSYYSDYEMAMNAKGKALAEVNVEDVQKWDGEAFGFMFMTTEQVPYYVYADSDRERTKWMNALIKLTNTPEEPEQEQKKCPNCLAILTGTRFCGACGYNLRASATGERNASAPPRVQPASQDDVLASGEKEDGDLMDDEDNAFDELEALSEGARTLLLAVMQTPEGVDVGEQKGAFPTRTSNPALRAALAAEEGAATDKPTPRRSVEEFSAEEKDSQDRGSYPDSSASPASKSTDDFEMKSEGKPQTKPITEAPPPDLLSDEDEDDVEQKDIDQEDDAFSFGTPAPAPTKAKPKPAPVPKAAAKPKPKARFSPSFDFDYGKETTSSFTSFSDSDEETKIERKPAPSAKPKMVAPPGMPVIGRGLAPRRTLNQLVMESSSDEEEEEESKRAPPLPTKPPSMEFGAAAQQDVQQEEKPAAQTKAAAMPSPTSDAMERRSSADSLELDTRGIAAFDEPASAADRTTTSRMGSGMNVNVKKDLYHHLERELDFQPLFVPSSESPVRCRLYGSMAYSSTTKVILFLSDSGPLGLWRQDAKNQDLTLDHPWSMLTYITRAQEEGYGIVVCNPFANTAVVYEAGGFEREVPIPNSTTPKEHVLFVWEKYIVPCRGQVSVIAYARGGALIKSVLETYESTAREKLGRIAFIESQHEIDGNEGPGVLELLGRRSINWESSYEPLGGQIVDSQARVGCVCLSVGYVKPGALADDEANPALLSQAEEAVFSFIGANPDRPGMTAVVKAVRLALKQKKNATIKKARESERERRKSNVLVLGETDPDESSDHSTGATEESSPMSKEEKPSTPYYLPKPVPKPAAARSSSSSNTTANSSISSAASKPRGSQISVKDFDLLKVVGQGGFGKVFLCRKLTPPHQGDSFAMKVLKKQQVLSSGLVNTTMAERHILTEISHPFVVKLYYAFQSESKLYLVMDYLSGGSLAFHLRRRRKFPEEWARFYAAEVAAAIGHLHSVNIIYRDAKLENVLMDHEGHVRITDFGLSKVGVSGLKGATTFCGTAAYIAPELLKGDMYGKAADWWSFGILLYEMIGGKPPYYHRNRDIMFRTILNQEWVTFSPSFSDSAVSLIRGLLTRDPMMRLGSGPRGADEILTHPFFDSIDWRALLEKKISPPFNPGVGQLDTHYAPRHLNEITPRDREASVMVTNNTHTNDFDGFSFVGRPSLSK